MILFVWFSSSEISKGGCFCVFFSSGSEICQGECGVMFLCVWFSGAEIDQDGCG